MVLGNENVGKSSLARCLVEFWNGSNRQRGKAVSLADLNAPPRRKDTSQSASALGLSSSSAKDSALAPQAAQVDPRSASASDLNAPLLSTDGISRSDASVTVRGTLYSLAIWDFAGQEVYHASHFLFLADRCVYVIAFDVSQPVERSFDSIDYWLRIVSSVSNSAPVLFVGTHIDAIVCTVEYLDTYLRRITDRYKSVNANILSFVGVSNRSKKNLPDLAIAIGDAVAGLPGVNEALPALYLQFEQQLQLVAMQTRPPVISFARFTAIAAKTGLEHARSVLSHLRQLGVVVTFHGVRSVANTDMVVIDPTWLIDLCKSFLSTSHRFITVCDAHVHHIQHSRTHPHTSK